MSKARRPAGRPAARALALADRLLAGGADGRGEGALPSPGQVAALAEEFVAVLLPGSGRLADLAGLGPGDLRAGLATAVASLERRLAGAVFLELHRACGNKKNDDCDRRATSIATRVADVLPDIQHLLVRDVRAALEADPAATSTQEILACYPGLYAITVYRVAHRLLGEGVQIVPRMLTEHAHARTGIDIHPGARIGCPFFIDHGTGIVIGETTVIGNAVRIFQGVTLGALSVKRRAAGLRAAGAAMKRHPTIEDEVIIYANATILGGETVIGRGAVVGGNAWITYSVPPGIRVGVGT